MPERVLLRIPTRVKDIQEEFRETTTHKDAEGNFDINRTSLGWFVLFEGSRERLLVGPTKPDNLHIGDTVFIDIVKQDGEGQ